MEFRRLLNKDHQPTNQEIIAAIGEGQSWLNLIEYIDQSYDFSAELVFYGQKYGWTLRYRKKNKTLVSLFPEQGAFSVLIVLGKKEVEKVMDVLNELSSPTQNVIKNTKQLHDGKWLWIRVFGSKEVDDVKLLINAKRKPIIKGS